MQIGYDSGSNGTMVISGGTMSITNNNADAFIVGYKGTADVSVTGGELRVTGDGQPTNGGYLYVGYQVGSLGTMTVSGGTVTAKRITAGYESGSDGTMVISGGTVTSTDTGTAIRIGHKAKADVSVTGGKLLAQNGYLIIGHDDGSVGKLQQTGGEITTKHLTIGKNGSGTVKVSGGSLTTSSLSINAQSTLSFIAGNNGFGTLTVTGALTQNGTINVDLADGLSLITGYDPTEGWTLMTVVSGTPTATSLNDMLNVPTFANKALNVTLKQDGFFKGTFSAVSGGLTLDTPSAQGWVYLTDLTGSDPFQITLTLDPNANRETVLAGLNAEFALYNGDDQLWKADKGLRDDQVLITGVASAMTAPGTSNVFAWDFGHTDFGGAMLAGVRSQQVPEPAAWLMMLVMLLGGGVWFKSRRRG